MPAIAISVARAKAVTAPPRMTAAGTMRGLKIRRSGDAKSRTVKEAKSERHIMASRGQAIASEAVVAYKTVEPFIWPSPLLLSIPVV